MTLKNFSNIIDIIYMTPLKDVVNYLIKDRKNYKNLTNKEKDYNFFIINRFMSKKYPHIANKLNLKSMDKSMGLDIWFFEIGKEIKEGNIDFSFFKWFWSKSPKTKENDLSITDNKYLLSRLNLTQDDLNFLMRFYEEDVLDELSYLKKLDKQ